MTATAPVRLSRGAPAIGLLVLIALAVSALVPAIGPLALVALVAGFVLSPRGSSLRWAAAAAMPVALMFSWAWLIDGSIARTGLDCADPVSPLALSRLLEAIVVVGLIALLARWLGSRCEDLGLRRPSRSGLLLGVLAIATIPLLSLLIGPILAEPFFGPMQLELAPAALVSAVVLAVANGTMEELAYRGALMQWNSKAFGISAALVGQAAVFGLAHLGDDFVGSPLPVMVAVGLGGLAAGLIARRTGSLYLPIVVHICLDVPLYFAIACRLS